MYRNSWVYGSRPTGSILTCSPIYWRSGRTMSGSLLARRFGGAVCTNRRTGENERAAVSIEFGNVGNTCLHRVRSNLTMTPQTLNDIFFAIVERGQERLMLVRDEARWTPISAQE